MARDLLIEIGTEEIPAAFFPRAIEDLRDNLAKGLAAARLSHGAARLYGTPRRLAVLVEGVLDAQPDVTREEVGPPVKVAFDAEGKPTKAALNFAEKVGVPVEKLARKQQPKGEYIAATVEEKGRSALEVLPQILHDAVANIPWRKSMRWGNHDVQFARPVHWILARFGGEVVPFGWGDVESGGVTWGHRFLANRAIEVPEPAAYVETLRRAEVVVDPAERRQAVRAAAEQGAKEAGGTLLQDDELFEHVTWLVERPSPIVGTFDESFLDLPKEVLVSEMKGHQKYFSVNRPGDTGLLPAFVAIANTPVKDPSLARRGFERVLRARLSDGRFFFDEDRKSPLVDRVERLKKVTFQAKLGSIHEKVERFRAVAAWLGQQLGLSAAAREHVERAATLAKADLVTGMVGEFPELQGVMGREYAVASGEPDEVAVAVFEHYLPRGYGDQMPAGDVGAVVGIADRIDTIVGIFGIGKPPTGSADPFGLRRACLGVIQVTLQKGYRYSIAQLIDRSLVALADRLALPAPEVKAQVLDFFRTRLKNLWAEQHPVEIVEAVLAAGFDDLLAVRARLSAVDQMLGDESFRALAEGFSRTNIVEKAKSIDVRDVDPQLFEKDAERVLFKSFLAARKQVDERLQVDDYAAVLRDFTSLQRPLDQFFTDVMVMAEDPKVRDNRLRLLSEVRELFGRVADFGKMDLKRIGGGSREAR
ncbi:glycine--tRNA ligase subunit beta [Vulgatibacter sp.]|uniref:glycine--tRNA ligase subunit beta n=1 Tax=Vulgatibacter sp. TaxID=1971226 RepID=UPI0035677C44